MNRSYYRPGAVLFVLGCVLFFLVIPLQVTAQEPIQVTDQAWDSDFRNNLKFNLRAESPSEIVEADLFYRVVGQLATSRNDAEFTPGRSIEAEYLIDQTDPSNYLPPGAELEYWWKVVDAEGNEFKTERETLLYVDNHHDWQSIGDDRVTLYWYEGDPAFGQSLFDRANIALDTLESDIGIALDDPIKIFIYGNHRDLLSALSVTAQEWTGGVAYTEHGVVVIGINPSQLDWGLNAMTHEMTHLVIHQATDNPFSGLPRWLDEGIAVYNENRDELDVDFRPVFERAVANDELMTLRTLTSPFPADPMQANLAYGQSGATVKFIVDTYGSEAMAELLKIFSEGALYDEALEQALGVDTDALDNAVRTSVGLGPLPGTEMAVEDVAEVEPAVKEESAQASEPAADAAEVEGVPESAEPEVASEADSSGTEAVAAGESPAQAAPAAPETSGLLPCAAGLLFLFVAGGAVLGWRFVR
jgi:hypothetical protein